MTFKHGPLLIGLDVGTSGVRALAFTSAGDCVARGQASFATSYPEPGWAEQSPSDWWSATCGALRDLTNILGDASNEIVGMGLTGQCPTFACLNLDTGPVGPALLYQDNRATLEVGELVQRFGANTLRERSGQTPSAFYILPKLLWLRKHRPQQLTPGTAIVQPRDLVGWYLTGHLGTDPTHAACTLAYDLLKQDWTYDWLEAVGPENITWPPILPANSILGYLTREAALATNLLEELPIIIGAADSICAAYGADATALGILCEVTGTSTCLHLSSEQMLTQQAINVYPHVEPGQWCLEVGLNTTGGALAWLASLLFQYPQSGSMNDVSLPSSPTRAVHQMCQNKSIDFIPGQNLEVLLQAAERVEPGAEGLLFLPHLSGGERDAPWRCGAFVELHLGHTAGHMTRAVLEGVTYALRQRIELLKEAGCTISRVVSCGGAARSPLWSQIKADILTLPVDVVEPYDTAAWGAARLAAEALNVEVTAQGKRMTFLPEQEQIARYQNCYERFCRWEQLCKER